MLTNQSPDLKNQNEEDPQFGMDYQPNRNFRIVSGILLLLAIIAIPACFVLFSEKQGDSKKPRQKPPVIVTTAFAQRQDIPLSIHAVGNVESVESVSVRARVDGELMEVFFHEGQDVKKGDPLFRVDPRTLEETVQQEQANLAQCHSDVLQQASLINRDIAELRRLQASLESTVSKENLAKRQWDRYSDLERQGAVSREQEDQMRTNFESMVAGLKADQAAIDNQKAVIESDRSRLLSLQSKENSAKSALAQAKIQLGYCLIRSPIDGRTGSLLVHRGNMIKANDPQPLVVINRLRPIYVTFALPEGDFAQVKQFAANGNLKVDVLLNTDGSANEAPLGRADTLPGSTEDKHKDIEGGPNVLKFSGNLSFVDNAVQTTTGTIKLKGIFENESGMLWPGQFVNVALNLTTLRDVVVVPSEAVQVGQQGQYVFVVKPDNTVEIKRVTVNRVYHQKAVVSSGLNGDEQVVTDGQVQLSQGSQISISNAFSQNKSNSNSLNTTLQISK